MATVLVVDDDRVVSQLVAALLRGKATRYLLLLTQCRA
jgi:CheY-like chemotaxis protein